MSLRYVYRPEHWRSTKKRAMIEVFKTNVRQKSHASMLVAEIHKAFTGYKANFDLDDCDNILRIKSNTGAIQIARLIDLVKHFGFCAEVLPDIATTHHSSAFTNNIQL